MAQNMVACLIELVEARFHPRRRAVAAAIFTALLAGACGGPGIGPLPDGPNWSLADKKPASLGGSGATQQTATTKTGPTYEYRGGRDPVTGRSASIQPPPPITQPRSTTVTSSEPKTVEVRKGDTLHGLSLSHHVSVKALMEANNLKSTTIMPGKKLVIPTS